MFAFFLNVVPKLQWRERAVRAYLLRLSILIVFASPAAFGQHWNRIPLPPGIDLIKVAGNPMRANCLALWGLRRTISDTAAQIYLTPWVMFTTSDAGSTWSIQDSGFFSRTANPSRSTNWHRLVYVDGTILRSMYTTEPPNDIAYYYSRSEEGAPFLPGQYPGPVGNLMGSSLLDLASQGVSYNLRYELGQDSASMALYKSDGPGTPWTIVPDSLRGFHMMPTPTTLSFRLQSQNIMFLGTRYGLSISGNAGLTWTKLRTETALDRSTISLVHIHPKESNLVYASGRIASGEPYQHLYRSTDNGVSWREVFRDSLITHVALTSASVPSILIGTQSSLYASQDTGASWQQVRFNLPLLVGFESLQSLFFESSGSAVYAAIPRALYRSDDWFLPTTVEPTESRADPVIDIFPNPVAAGANLNIRYNVPGEETAVISAFDALGMLRWKSAHPLTGSGNGTIPFGQLNRFAAPISSEILFFILETPARRSIRRITILR